MPTHRCFPAFCGRVPVMMLLVVAVLSGCGETGQRGPVSVSKLEPPLSFAVLPGVATVQNEYFDVETPVEVYAYPIPNSSQAPLAELKQRYASWATVETGADYFIVKTNRIIRSSYSMTSFIAVYLPTGQSEIVFGYGAMPTRIEGKMLSGLKNKIQQIIRRRRSKP